MGVGTRIGKVADATNGAATDTLTSNAPAGGTGATAGAYDNSTNRDLMIACVNGLNATVASMLVTQNAMRVDMAAMLSQLNEGE